MWHVLGAHACVRFQAKMTRSLSMRAGSVAGLCGVGVQCELLFQIYGSGLFLRPFLRRTGLLGLAHWGRGLGFCISPVVRSVSICSRHRRRPAADHWCDHCGHDAPCAPRSINGWRFAGRRRRPGRARAGAAPRIPRVARTTPPGVGVPVQDTCGAVQVGRCWRSPYSVGRRSTVRSGMGLSDLAAHAAAGLAGRRRGGGGGALGGGARGRGRAGSV
eukprot:COSAG04_NODE_463_length_13963_cov_7.207588_5_plen_217_part_00